MSNSKDSGDRIYRRGLVIGLTLAEVMLLVLFALLLVLGWSAQQKDEDTEFVDAMRTLLPVETGVAGDVIAELTAAVRLGRAVSAMAGEGVLGPDASGDRLSSRTTELLTLGALAESALGPNSSGMSANAAAREVLGVASVEHGKARRSQGHGSARIWLEWLVQNQPQGKGGNGLVFPSCVPNSDEGTTQYIYDVTLGSEGIVVVDKALAEMERWSDETASVEFDRVVSQSTFNEMTQPLYDWSDQNQCRFFVRVYDATAPFEKALYKEELNTVERHFYKFLADVVAK